VDGVLIGCRYLPKATRRLIEAVVIVTLSPRYLTRYCVVTATLVDPRTIPVESENCTDMRLSAGAKGTASFAVAKIPKVGVFPFLTVVVTLVVGVPRHWPEIGSVWHSVKVKGE
jgi:hypothetical protein